MSGSGSRAMMTDPLMVLMSIMCTAGVMGVARLCEWITDLRQALRRQYDSEKKILKKYVKTT